MHKPLLLILSLLLSSKLYADTTLVAVAANFSKPMGEIAAEFEKTSGHSAKLSLGSSGKFVTQIENGAPYEVFLAADSQNPQKLEQDGFAVSGSRFVFAKGKLVLWSANPNMVDPEGLVLKQGQYQHLAIADPALAPYGRAASEVLAALAISPQNKTKLVIGENIAQTHQFVQSGNAELGLLALSQVYENGRISSGSAWIVPSTLYAPIQQSVVLLKRGANNPAALALMEFLKSATALAIMQKYGYEVENL